MTKLNTLYAPKISSYFNNLPFRDTDEDSLEYLFEFSSVDTNHDVFIGHFPTKSRARAAEYARLELMALGHVNPIIHA